MDKAINVLVVEDSEDDTLLLMRELERGGYRPTYERVESAKAMAEALAQQRWDLVITDYTMPHFDAQTALSLLKESGFDIPFIIISGTIGEERAVAAMRAGASDYLKKGNLARLNPIIDRELREAHLRAERREAKAALEERERYFRALIENSADIIVTMDESGIITYASPALFRTIGSETTEYTVLNLLELIHPEDKPKNRALFVELLQQPGGVFATEFRLKDAAGNWLWLEAVMSNLSAEPGVRAIVANLRDVTERKELLAQLVQAQKMEAVGQLTAGIAHDFNNMLTVINSYAELLQIKFRENEPMYRMAARILEGGERAANLVQQLLAFSHKQITSPEILALNDVVLKMDTLLARTIGEHIKMSTNLAPDLWTIKADPTQIEQIIVNLAVNARDAMPSGGNLHIETTNMFLDENFATSHLNVSPGSYVLLSMSDTGTGMTEEVKSRIFEPFFTTKEVGKGTGLGLSTVYGTVKQNGGSIWVYSEVDEGTRIEIYLPKNDGKVAPTAVAAEPRTDIGPADETILMVEDNDGVRQLVTEILSDIGYTILAARDGQEALKQANSYDGPIHLLLTDVVMPGINGRRLAALLAEVRPDLKVLFMSGYSAETIVHHGVVDPTVSLLQKPYNPYELARRVREILDA